jgi:C4-dicarboxylate-specific signal transduction histidine kinase
VSSDVNHSLRLRTLVLSLSALAVWVVVATGWSAPKPDVGFIAFALTALALELYCPRLPGFGFASGCFVLYLGCAMRSDMGVVLATFLLGVSLLLRSLMRRHSSLSLTLEELVEDAFPAFAALLAFQLLNEKSGLPKIGVELATVALYIPLSLVLSRLVTTDLPQAQRGRRNLALERMMPLTLCGGLLVLGVGRAPALLAVVVALLLQLGLALAVSVAEAQDRGLLELKLKKTEETLASTGEDFNSLLQGFRLKKEECRLLEATSAEIVMAQDLGQAVERLLELASKLVRNRSLVFFRAEGDGLVFLRCRSPKQKELEAAELVGANIRIVESAWKARTPRTRARRAKSEPLGDEASAVAFPIGRYGVLYCGRVREQFTDSELKLLTLLTDQARLALFTAERTEARRKAYDESVQHGEKLHSKVAQLDVFLDASLKLSETVSEVELLQRAGPFLPRLAASDAGLFIVGSKRLCFGCREEALLSEPLLEIVEAVTSRNEPVAVVDIAQSPFAAPLEGARSLLAVPLKQPEGVLLLLSRQSQAYSIAEQERLSLFALLLAQAAERLRLHKRVLRSSKLAAVGQLAAGMAHEINNPLAAVSMGIESAMLLIEQKPDRARERLESADSALTRVRNIVEKLLSSTREAPEEGRAPLELSHLISQTLKTLEPLLEKSNIRVTMELSSLSTVMGHEENLHQVLTNLVLNASDALSEVPDTRRELFLSMGEEGGKVVVEVRDTGSGMEPDVVGSIFDPFFTTKPPGKGVGLGLSLSRDIIRQHGGTIEVDSVLGEGTRFRVVLPLLTKD